MMFHTKSKTTSGLAIRQPSHRKLVLWDVTIVVAILASLAFVAVRTNAAQWTRLTSGLFQDHSGNQAVSWESTESQSAAELIAALKSPDPNIRINAAQALGTVQGNHAIDALLSATYDSDSRVVEQAAMALGKIGAIQAAPRLRELQIVQGNTFIQVAANQAMEKIEKSIAARLNVPRDAVQAVAVAQNGIAYAVVSNNLYTANDGGWLYLSRLPDSLNDLAVTPDGQSLFVATQATGLYRSQNRGQTWEYLEFGLHTPTQLTTTAVVVDPEKVQRLYLALAVGSEGEHVNSLGIAVSNDGGKTWVILPDSPPWSVTRHLIIDHTTPEFLYGLADEGPWRYALTADASSN